MFSGLCRVFATQSKVRFPVLLAERPPGAVNWVRGPIHVVRHDGSVMFIIFPEVRRRLPVPRRRARPEIPPTTEGTAADFWPVSADFRITGR